MSTKNTLASIAPADLDAVTGGRGAPLRSVGGLAARSGWGTGFGALPFAGLGGLGFGPGGIAAQTAAAQQQQTTMLLALAASRPRPQQAAPVVVG